MSGQLTAEQREMIEGPEGDAPHSSGYSEDRVECLVVDWSDRGFGFLQTNDGRRAYCHAKAIGGGNLQMGETVLAIVSEDTTRPGKWTAVDVMRTEHQLLGSDAMPSASTRTTSGVPEATAPTAPPGGRLEGIVAEWNTRGFGFISFSDGRRAYVHHSAIGGGNLEPGETVIASVTEDATNPGKWAAQDVQRVILLPKATKRSDKGSHSDSPPVRRHYDQCLEVREEDKAQNWQRPHWQSQPQEQSSLAQQHPPQFPQQYPQQYPQQPQHFQQQPFNQMQQPQFGRGYEQQAVASPAFMPFPQMLPMFFGGMGMPQLGEMHAPCRMPQKQQAEPAPGPRYEGVVREWNRRGFGFIVLHDDRRVYVHHSSVLDTATEDGPVNLEPGDLVSAVIMEDTQNPGKWAAADVRRINRHAAPSPPPDPLQFAGASSVQSSRSDYAPQQQTMQLAPTEHLLNGEERMEGQVAEWSDRGFGFIVFRDGRRAYVHHSQVEGDDLAEGETVHAVVSEDNKNPGKWAALDVLRGQLPPPPRLPPGADAMQPGLGAEMGSHVGGVPGEERVEGIVAQWSPKGFGFLNLSDGRRAYVHVSAFDKQSSRKKDLVIGETVNAVIVEDPQNEGKWQARGLQHGPAGEDGVVVEWRKDGGFGFLDMDDGRRVYVHHSSFGGGNLLVGSRFRVVTQSDPRNPGKWSVSEIRTELFGSPGSPSSAGGPPECEGTVLEWDHSRGFGFVQTEDGRRVYAHHSAFGIGDLEAGERVRIAVVPDQRNPGKFMAATLVRLSGKVGAAAPEPGMPPSTGAGKDHEWEPGTVADWLEDRGYGFLELVDGRRVYVHHSAFGGGSLTTGEVCEVAVASDRMNPGKWRAAAVRGTAVVPRPPDGRRDSDSKRPRHE